MSLSVAFDDKERVRQSTEIVDLIGAYLPLRRQGRMYVTTCPWHDDHKPSLQVNPDRQSWKCWVCDIGGDAFSFVMKRENMDFREALKFLAARAGIELSGHVAPKTVAGNPNDKATLFQACQWANHQFHQCLMNAHEAEKGREYLAERGISEQAIATFQIGFAPNRYSFLSDLARTGEFSMEVLQACGLVSKSNTGSSWYERFRGRIIFPIFDVQNRPIAFGGRILPFFEEQSDRPSAKYINSPETRLYSKSDQLYGLNLARNVLTKERHLIIVEGYTDVIGAWQSGIENVAAVCGTAIGARHIQNIHRFADKVTLVLDGDDAGQKRAAEILELFVAANIDLRIITLPEGMDPCDYLANHGAGEFRNLIRSAHDALEHKLKLETGGIDLIRDTHRANAALDSILKTIAAAPASSSQTGDQRLRVQQMLTRLSRMFQVDLQDLQRRLSQWRARTTQTTSEKSDSTALLAVPQRERDLIQLLLMHSSAIEKVFANLLPDQFVEGAGREIYRLCCQCREQGQPVDFHTLMLRIEDPQLKHFLNELDEESQVKTEHSETAVDVQLECVLNAFIRASRETQRRQTMQQLAKPEIEEQEETKLLEDLIQQAREGHGIELPTDG